MHLIQLGLLIALMHVMQRVDGSDCDNKRSKCRNEIDTTELCKTGFETERRDLVQKITKCEKDKSGLYEQIMLQIARLNTLERSRLIQQHATQKCEETCKNSLAVLENQKNHYQCKATNCEITLEQIKVNATCCENLEKFKGSCMYQLDKLKQNDWGCAFCVNDEQCFFVRINGTSDKVAAEGFCASANTMVASFNTSDEIDGVKNCLISAGVNETSSNCSVYTGCFKTSIGNNFTCPGRGKIEFNITSGESLETGYLLLTFNCTDWSYTFEAKNDTDITTDLFVACKLLPYCTPSYP